MLLSEVVSKRWVYQIVRIPLPGELETVFSHVRWSEVGCC
jgi:hypothetical protein